MKEKLTIVMLLLSLCAYTQTANPYNVVIDEIIADPSPVVGLPNTEFIELRNVSTQPFNLNGWRIGDASGFATITLNFVLKPDSFVVICTNSAVASFSVFGTTIGVTSFPSLDNDGDQLYLRSKEGKVIHAVNYSSDWYNNAVKNQGGWALEMIDTKNPCGNGRPVRYLTHNALCGLQGYFRWDGLDEKNAKLPIGVYVILSDVFNLQGKTKRFKQAVTLARRLN